MKAAYLRFGGKGLAVDRVELLRDPKRPRTTHVIGLPLLGRTIRINDDLPFHAHGALLVVVANGSLVARILVRARIAKVKVVAEYHIACITAKV